VTPVHGHGSRPLSTLARRLASTLGALAVLAVLALCAAAVPAAAQVVKAEGVEVGLQPRSVSLTYGSFGYGPLEEPFTNRAAFKFANPKGEPILAATRVYAIYWDPTDNYHGDWQGLIDGFLAHMGGASGSDAVFSVDAQYTDKENQHATYDSTFMGAYTDTDVYPPQKCTDPAPLEGETSPGDQPAAITCLTNAQIQEELKLFIADHNTLQKGMGTIYYLLTPPGVTVCLDAGGATGHCSDYYRPPLKPSELPVEKEEKEEEEHVSYEKSFCSYHSDISPTSPAGDANTILYAVIPWIAGAFGDGHLPREDQTTAFDCQDGGFNPASKPDIEEREKKQEKTKKQEEEEAKKEKTHKEEEAQETQDFLEGPHQEEPNQPTGNGPDGNPDTGLADLIIGQIANEQQNIVTDPLLKSWQGQEKVKLLDGEEVGYEDTDECRDFFYPALGGSVGANELTAAGSLYDQELEQGHYYLNDAFNLAGLELPYPAIPCMGGIDLIPQFTAPNPVNAGETVGFDGMESDITLNWGIEYSATGEPKTTYAVYKWNFGDGSPEVSGYAPGAPPGEPPSTICEEPWRAPCAASTFHSYKYGGTYNVTLTVTDTGGNTATVTHPVTVLGPAPPSEGGSGSGSAGGGSTVTPQSTAPASSTPQGSSPSTTGQSVVLPGPVATAAAVAASPKQVARGGLVIHYTVNEQVAGRFEVLLAAATAHKLGIGGRVATGLPAGSAKALVIGQALLVTTKGGHSSVRIKFDKRTARHLRHAHTVKLTLRMIVRNASKNPAFTTVTSTVVLHG
jgi:hypothetical protein